MLTVLVLSDAMHAQPGKPGPTLVVEIRATDQPERMPAVQQLLRDSAEGAIARNAWQQPPGDPGQISKSDYLDALRPYAEAYERLYGQEPARPMQYAYEAVPVFAAFWKATGEKRYADLMRLAIRNFCLWVEKDLQEQNSALAKSQAARPKADNYWTDYYVYVVVPLLEMEAAPGYREMTALLGAVLGARANAWPIYWERGAHNRPIDAAFWYDTALKFGTGIPRAAELRAYADLIWTDWWPHRDIEEDCPHYTGIDLVTLDTWSRIRGVAWWRDAQARKLWQNYAEQVANDGSWPAYGDGGVYGDYFIALRIAELAAARTGEGRYKWLAHRAFWNARSQLAALTANIGNLKVADLAMAYLYADDRVQETPPQSGLTVTWRRFRERTDWTKPDEKFFILHDELAPSKLIFRGGPREGDQFLMVQAGSQAGHGHPDTGSVIQYSGDFAYYLSHGVSRLDHDMELHNMFTVREPGSDRPWKRGAFTVEQTSVPASGVTSEASYARLRIGEYPGIAVDEQRWKEVLAWKGTGYPPSKAIGYRNWPMRLERSIVLVANRFTVVRDVATFLLPAKAQMGQNWVIGSIGPRIGTHWVNVWTPQLFGYPYSDPPRAPVSASRRDLLIWFAPQKDATMQIVDGPKRSWYGNYYINLPRRVWYPRTSDGDPATPQAFTTVLMPHEPAADPRELAATISAIHDAPDLTVLAIASTRGRHIVVLNSSGGKIRTGDLETDAEAAVLFYAQGKAEHFSAWNATSSSLRGKVIARSEKPESVDVKLPALWN